MLKKVVSIILAVTLCLSMVVGAYADDDVNKVMEIYPASSVLRRASYTYDSFSIGNGYTMILGSSTSSNGYYHIDAGTTVVLTTKLSSNEDHIDMGYIYSGNYTECNWSKSSGLFKYTYTCSMYIDVEGDYKFFISNNTANSLTFTSTTLSY